RVTLPRLLALRGLAEIVVVDDGSADDTPAVLRELAGPRLRVIRHDPNRGSPAARNTGAAAATTEWVVFLEDDCGFPDDYAETLLRVAEREGADVVSAPWLNVPEEAYAAEVARRRAAPERTFGLDTHVSTFPPEAIETPFLCALALVRRDVVTSVRYDETLRGNAWREETDFYLRCAEAGYRCVLTPETASWQAGRWSGGQHPAVLPYEYWLLRNNWRFLRRHEAYLTAHGGVDSVVKAELRLARHRAVTVGRRAGGAVKRAVLPGSRRSGG
ncbi:MAG TPA: glycosyltransferase, partial [Mycobacteriales bacterium]|nr:glycosyltransferase [Mycobacteriales bacterium]